MKFTSMLICFYANRTSHLRNLFPNPQVKNTGKTNLRILKISYTGLLKFLASKSSILQLLMNLSLLLRVPCIDSIEHLHYPLVS